MVSMLDYIYEEQVTLEKIIKEFEKTANIIQDLQSKQEKLHISNEKNEDERNKIFHDLDIDAKTELKKALKEYPGSILLICHEPEFYQDIVQQVWQCSEWSIKL